MGHRVVLVLEDEGDPLVPEYLRDHRPTSQRLRIAYKYLLRSCGLRCKDHQRLPREAELQDLIRSLADRVHKQSELLARRAEKGESE